MSVVAHIFGTAGADALASITRAFNDVTPLLAGGCERAELLVNHAERKVQFLMQFVSLEASAAFLKRHGRELTAPFEALVPDANPPAFFVLELEIDARRADP